MTDEKRPAQAPKGPKLPEQHEDNPVKEELTKGQPRPDGPGDDTAPTGTPDPAGPGTTGRS